jgi:hypothetical protein
MFFDPATNVFSGSGHVGSQTGTPIVTFSSSSPDKIDFANGFAQISPRGDLFHTLAISVPAGYTFTDIVFDILSPPDFTVTDSNGGTSTITGQKNGLAEYLALSGSPMTSLILSSTDGFTQIKQFEISGLTASVPEPSTWAMMVLGFAGLGFMA